MEDKIMNAIGDLKKLVTDPDTDVVLKKYCLEMLEQINHKLKQKKI